MTIEDDIRAAIKGSGLSQMEIANAAQTSRPNLNAFLAGRRGLGVETLSRIAQVLGYEIVLKRKGKRSGLNAKKP
jgi:transcriptional regulator with XRE-family HTH domain